MESRHETRWTFGILTIICVASAWQGNTFVQLHEKIAHVMNQTDCWICSQFPKGYGHGYPVAAIVFPNTSQAVQALSSVSLVDYTQISPQNLQWHIDFSGLWNETLGVPCVQRCHVNTTTSRNTGGNNTDPKCGKTKIFVGKYPNCSTYIGYGGANLWNHNQTRRGGNKTTPKGWPIPPGLGWYWICGQTGYKVLPLGWTGQCAIGTIFPSILITPNLTGYLRSYMRRIKRGSNPIVQRPTAFHSFARWFLPWLGVSELEKALVNVSATLEIINNSTIDAIQALQEEVTSLSKVVFQNRLGLDMLFAQQGGLCTVLNERCCTYINQDKRIETDLSRIWEQTQILHLITQDNTSWGFQELWDKLTSWLPDLKWLKQIFVIIVTLIALGIIISIQLKCFMWGCQKVVNHRSSSKYI